MSPHLHPPSPERGWTLLTSERQHALNRLPPPPAAPHPPCPLSRNPHTAAPLASQAPCPGRGRRVRGWRWARAIIGPEGRCEEQTRVARATAHTARDSSAGTCRECSPRFEGKVVWGGWGAEEVPLFSSTRRRSPAGASGRPASGPAERRQTIASKGACEGTCEGTWEGTCAGLRKQRFTGTERGGVRVSHLHVSHLGSHSWHTTIVCDHDRLCRGTSSCRRR